MNLSEDDTVLIWSLNDDCLLHIISFLDQIERLKLSFVCQRFYNIVERSIKATKLFEFDIQTMDLNFNLMQIRQILKSFGTHIRSLYVCTALEAYNHLECIALNCRNLVEVNFKQLASIRIEMYKQFFTSSKQLQTLVLKDCSIDNEVCKIISLLPSLSYLNLSYNRNITGEFLRNLKTVTELNLSNCAEINPVNFIEICKSLQLKKLNIIGCYRLNEKAFLTLAETQTTLEEILMSNSYGEFNLAYLVGQLGSLKHVTIHSFERDSSDGANVLSEIMNNRKDSLESLEIYNMFVEERIHDRILDLSNLRKLSLVGDSNLDDNYLQKISKNSKLVERVNIAKSQMVSEIGVLSLVQNLKHLKYLNISFCWGFKDSLFRQIYNILEEAGDSERKSPLSLCVYDIGVEQSSLNMEHKKLLSLSLQNDIPSDMNVSSSIDENNYYDYYCDCCDSDSDHSMEVMYDLYSL